MRTYYFRIRMGLLRDCNSVRNPTAFIHAVSELGRRSDGPRTEKVNKAFV